MFTAEELEECDIFPKKLTTGTILKILIYLVVMVLALALMYSFYSGRDFTSIVSMESMKYSTGSYYIELLAQIDSKYDYNSTDKYSINVDKFLDNPKILIKDHVSKSIPLIIKNVSSLKMFKDEEFLSSYIDNETEVIVEKRQDPNGFLNKEEYSSSIMKYKLFKEEAQNTTRSKNYFIHEAYSETLYEEIKIKLEHVLLKGVYKDMNLLSQGIKFTEGFDEMLDAGHYDTSENMFCQIQGEVDLMVIPVLQRNYVYPFKNNYGLPNYSATNFFKAEYGRFPGFKSAHRLYITLSKGDCVFLPSYWWYSIKTNENKHFVYLKFEFKSHSRWVDYIVHGLETDF